MVNHRTLTAAMIDSRDFLAARRRAETEVLLPAGPKIAFTGGLDFNDHHADLGPLDKVHAKHPDMVLLHGGSPKGAERIAACWADNRKVTQIAFKPDWTRHAKAAPFKRNDQMLEVLPIGVIVFPGSGIQDNLADKARRLGIPVWRFTEDGASLGAVLLRIAPHRLAHRADGGKMHPRCTHVGSCSMPAAHAVGSRSRRGRCHHPARRRARDRRSLHATEFGTATPPRSTGQRRRHARTPLARRSQPISTTGNGLGSSGPRCIRASHCRAQ